METVIAMTMIMPPMVGVPLFAWWLWGPSSLICCMMLIFLSHLISSGAIIKLIARAVIAAKAVLNVMYLNTLNAEI
jgi:hypothetical protein